jgi:4-amino-4-deoxy-L-arabinose transferase-like glycosyltransferase
MGALKALNGRDIGYLIPLAALCFLLFFWNLGEIPFYTRGEPREGLVVWEMYSTGNWILPQVNGDYIPFKPPLFHWFGVIIAKVLGRVDEFSVRFPSALFGTLGVFLTYLAGAHLWGKKAGIVSAFVLATSPEWWQTAIIAQVDITLAFFISAALLLFFSLYRKGESRKAESLGLALLLALGTLAKGPLGVLLPSLTIFIFLCAERNLAFLKKLHLLPSAILFLLLAGFWYGLATWEGGQRFLLRQIVDENLLTAAGVEGHYQPFYYFIPVFLLNTAPWSLFFPSLCLYLYSRRQRLREEQLHYPLIWLAVVFLFFSLSLGKRGVYILPLYPAAALLLGAWWTRLEQGEIHPLWLVRLPGYLVAASYLFLTAAVLFHSLGWNVLDHVRLFHTSSNGGIFSLFLDAKIPPSLSISICLAAFLLAWGLSRKSWNSALVSLAVMTTATALIIKDVYYPRIAAERTLKPFMERVRQEADGHAPLLFYRSFDYGAIFYAGRHIASYSENEKNFQPPFFLLLWEDEWQQIWTQRDLRVVDISEGTGPVGRHHLLLAEVTRNSRLPILEKVSTAR